MTDSDFVEFERKYSPDSSMILMNYGVDLGALGYGRAGTAVLRLSDTAKNLRDFTIKDELIKVHWKNNDTISGKVDILPFIRKDKDYEIKNQKINGIIIHVEPYDYIESDFERKVECRKMSPNGKYELVAYRYIKFQQDLKFIHVSVIETGQKIPIYGNFLIADRQSDYVFDGEWSSNNTLIFYTNDLYYDLVQYKIVESRPDIDYELKLDNERFRSKYRWTKKGSI